MACRCAERRRAIARAASHLIAGDTRAAIAQSRLVTVTAVEDMMKLMRPRIVPDLRKPTVATPKPLKRPS